jgi:predicted phosphoadenosine phosphosulfate sulfurtransferase
MARKEDLIYEDRNVYEAALDRIDRVYNSHDEVWVSYSGGKDSLVCLKLMEEYLDMKGYKDKINVIFRDEEVINGAIRDFVLSQYDDPRYNFVYLATPLQSEIYILGEKRKYVQWDEKRKGNWIVPKPDVAETMKGVMKQEEFEKYFFKNKRKRIALCIGIRAQESLLRFQGITASTIPYLTKSPLVKNVSMFKPVYDWSEKDVFKYFYDKDIEYCKVYDNQVFNKDPLRVASAIHAEAAKQLHKLKTNDPVLYNQIMEVFPEVDVQARYYKDMVKGKTDKIAYEYKEKAGDAWGAIYLYIKENITDEYQYNQAMQKVAQVRKSRAKNAKPDDPLAGFPALYVFGKIIGGGYKRSIVPTPDRHEKYYEYEDISNRS